MQTTCCFINYRNWKRGGAHWSLGFRSKLTGLLLFLSLLSYPLSILWISLGGGGSAPPAAPPLWLLDVVGRVQEELRGAVKEASGAPPSAPRGLYPACLLLSRVKMESMLSTSRRGLHLPCPPPEQLDLDSLLLLSASQSGSLLEEEQGAV